MRTQPIATHRDTSVGGILGTMIRSIHRPSARGPHVPTRGSASRLPVVSHRGVAHLHEQIGGKGGGQGVARLARPRLFTALQGARSVLIAGAGGGFDVYAGLPLAFALQQAGTSVSSGQPVFHRAGFARPGRMAGAEPRRDHPGHGRPGRILPRTHAGLLAGHPRPASHGVRVGPHRSAATARGLPRLVEHLDIDAVVLVDGGTDILLLGVVVGRSSISAWRRNAGVIVEGRH
jgi:hypothetical protein